MDNLRRALGTICREDFVSALSEVLRAAHGKATVDYACIQRLARDSTQELLLFAWEWKLLIPRKSLRCAEWDDRMMVMTPGEAYEMPNISKCLVETALKTGKWDAPRAISSLYQDMGAPDWEKMPALVLELTRRATNRTIRGSDIGAACTQAGTKYNTGAIIALLKSGGIISPKLGPIGPMGKPGSPIYEINPAISPVPEAENLY